MVSLVVGPTGTTPRAKREEQEAWPYEARPPRIIKKGVKKAAVGPCSGTHLDAAAEL